MRVMTGRAPLVAVQLTAVALTTVALCATPAGAHTEFRGSTPPADSVVTPQLDEVVLSFTGRLRTDLSTVVLIAPDRADYRRGAPKLRGSDIVQPVRRRLPTGSWTLAYRVIAADGHPLTGTLAFTVAGPAPWPTATPRPSSTSVPAALTEVPTRTALPADPSAAAAPPERMSPTSGSTDSPSYGGRTAAASAVIVILGAATAWALRRRGPARA